MRRNNLSEIETTLAGIILHNPGIIDREQIEPYLFADPDLHSIIEGILGVRNAGLKIDEITVLDELCRRGHCNLAARLAALEPYSPANAAYYAEKLRERLRAYTLHHALKNAEAELERGEKPTSLIADELFQAGTSALQLAAEPIDQSMRNLIPRFIDEMNERIQRRRSRKTIEIGTGIRPIDALMGSVHPGEVLIIAARPGTGKTALALQIARYNSKCLGLRTVFFSLEMLTPEIIDRLLAQEQCATLQQIREGQLSDEETKPVINTIGLLNEMPLVVFEGRHDLGLLRERIRREKAVHGVCLVIVDYLGLLDFGQPGKSPRWERISEASRALKMLALELRIVILLAVQLNREADGSEPTLGALRDSGALEQDADRVLLLHRPDERKGKDSGYARIIANLAKNRHGRTGRVELMFDGEHVRFMGG